MGKSFHQFTVILSLFLFGCSGGKPLTPSSTSVVVDTPKGAPFGDDSSSTTTTGGRSLLVDLRSNNQDGVLAIPNGSSLALSWISEGATSCELFENANTPMSVDRSGNRTIANLTSSTTYTIRCRDNEGNFKTDSVRVDIAGQTGTTGAASVKLLADGAKRIHVVKGSNVYLTWLSTNANFCDLKKIGGSQIYSSNLNESYGFSTGAINSDSTYVIYCVNQVSSATDFVDIIADGIASTASNGNSNNTNLTIPTIDLRVNNSSGPVSVNYNSTALVSWTSTGVLNCDVKLDSTSIKVAAQELAGITTAPLLQAAQVTATCPTAANPMVTVTDSVSIQLLEPTDQIIFVSSGTYNGNLGGLAGADQKCTQLATAANLRPSRPWRAVLSDNTISASARIVSRGPTKRVDGAVVFDTAIFGVVPKVAVSINQLGTAVNTGVQVWSNTAFSGAIRGSDDNKHCRNWTDTGDKDGHVGDIAASSRWVDAAGDVDSCDSQRYIYCISQ